MKKKNDKPSNSCNHKKIRFVVIIPSGHTNATLLLEKGATLKELQDWMGHKSMSTTADIYSHVQHKAKQRLSESISVLLAGGRATVG